jgi:hypothetical protein
LTYVKGDGLDSKEGASQRSAPDCTVRRRNKMSAVMRTLLGTLGLLVSLSVTVQAADKPNIILIVSDDFGYGDSGP